MAKETARWVRAKQPSAQPLEYGPNTTGCPAVEQAVEKLYAGQSEESFWALMSALNYALQMETDVLVPVEVTPTQTAVPAPWAANPIPEERAEGLRFWTLRSEKGDRVWLPVFTSSAAALQDRSTSSRPMAKKKLHAMMELVLAGDTLSGLVLDPWSRSASLERSLLNGLLHAERTTLDEADEAARQAEQKVRALLEQGDRCIAGGDPGRALASYRRAYAAAAWQPDISYWPEVCLRLARHEVRYTSREEALRLAAEARHGLRLRVAEGDTAARRELEAADALCRELTAQQHASAAVRAAYSTEPSQKD